jgi:GPH family glycoside/pentoside/hexuronide:cation symporter
MTDVGANSPEARLTGVQRHLYAAGHFGISFMGIVTAMWVAKFYFPNSPEQVNLVPAFLAPFIMALGRVTDGVNDPVVGYLSDSVRTRWGRRKPFMIVGLPLLCVFFVLVWYPPATEESAGNFWYASIILVLFFAAFTAYVGPYTAMLAEVAGSVDERVKLSALQGIYNVVGLVAGGLVTGAVLKSGMSDQQMAWLVTGVSLAAMLLPLFGPGDDPARVASQERIPFLRSVGMTLRNRPFRLYVIAQVLFYLGLMTIVAALPYLTKPLLNQEKGEAGTLSGIALLGGALCVPLIVRVADRRGSKAAFLFSLCWFAGSASLLALLGPFGRQPWGLWLARGLVILPGVAIGGLFALPYAILANITDYDRQRTGMDRQGMFFCVQGMILKIAFSCAPMVVVGSLALFAGYQATVLTLIGPLTGVFALAAYVAFRRFPEQEVLASVGDASTLEVASGDV